MVDRRELPRLRTGEDVRRVHRTPGRYFVKTAGGTAHAEMDCLHLLDDLTAGGRWREATDAQVRALGLSFCQSCT
jgi:hypothetical protein